VEEEAGFSEIEGAADSATLVFPSSFVLPQIVNVLCYCFFIQAQARVARNLLLWKLCVTIIPLFTLIFLPLSMLFLSFAARFKAIVMKRITTIFI